MATICNPLHPLPALLAAIALLISVPGRAEQPMAMDESMPMAHHHHDHHDMAAMAQAPLVRSTGDYQVPDVTLRNADGKAVALRSMLDDGEPMMLNFIYTSCTSVCPAMSGIFSQVQARLGKQVHLVSISIDPEYDTPARLKAYASRFNASPQWTLLTGRLEDSVAVQRAFASYRGDKMDHVAATFMRSAPGEPWLRIDGLASADELVQEYRHLAAH